MHVPKYAEYLESVYQNTRWDAARIPHGSINFTLRAIKKEGQAGPQSVILKHASPFFEDEGNLQPFSLNRQQVERAMLSLWNEGGLFAENPAWKDSWRVPKFIHHAEGSESHLSLTDKAEEASILLLEDLGEVVNLRMRIELWAQGGPSTEITNTVSRIGNILGSSLATLHSQETALAIDAHSEAASALSRSSTDDVVWYLAMGMVPTYLADVPKRDVYYQRLVKDIKSPQYTYPLCLVHGDFNFGNIMLPLGEDAKSPRPGIIDWEFAARNGRGVNGDVSEFLSSLHCRLISARRQPEQSTLAGLLRQLCQAFCNGYRQRAMLKCTMEAGDVSSQLYRSALLLNGRDMINYAQDACAQDEAFGDMMEVGLWYLERAGDDMAEFVMQSNCEELAREDEGLIRSLFMFE
jgi:hypothetical protein